uniref:polymorphic toxin type 28 domain-containing protein n=1 Tax=Pseudomonas sp. MEJ086 TaxID=3040319 RepID=UPI002556DE10
RGDVQTGQDSTEGLNRDVNSAYEITRDDEERTDLYVTKSSVEAVANPIQTFERWVKAAENYGDSSEEALSGLAKVFIAAGVVANGKGLSDVQQAVVKHEVLRVLGHRNSEKRLATARHFVNQIPGQATEAQREVIAGHVADIAARDPEAAFWFVYRLNVFAQGNPGQSNYAAVGVAVLGGLAIYLSMAASNPASMNNMEQLANNVMESVTQAGVAAKDKVVVSTQIWWLVAGTAVAFPIHQLDPKYGVLVNPGADSSGLENASSGGYNAGGSVVTVPHTGGSQLDTQQGDTSYKTPEHQLNPGNMYSGNGAKEAGSSATKLSQGEQKAVARIDNIIKNFKDHDIEGTLKDMAGDPVPRKNGSGYYDHLNEMQEQIRGLTNHAETLKNVSNPEAQAARQAALDTLKRISDSLNGAGI